MMKSNKHRSKKIYDELSKTLTDEEIADAYILPSNLSEEEKKKSHEEFLKLRMEHLSNMTDEDIQAGELMRMKIQINEYLSKKKYDELFSFGKQLKRYLKIIDRSQSKFSSEISINKTTLSRVINDREKPSTDLFYRLEKHSDKMISASLWYRIHSMKVEDEIKNNSAEREREYSKVMSTYNLGQAG